MSDNVIFNRPRRDFHFLDISFCMNESSPTYEVQNAKAECFMINNTFNKLIFHITEDGQVAVDDRLYLNNSALSSNTNR